MKEFLVKNKTKLKIVSTLVAASLAIAIVVSSALAFFKYEVEEEATIQTMKFFHQMHLNFQMLISYPQND